MSEILTYGDRLVTDAQVTKMGTFTSKGGGLMVQVQLPLDSGLAGIIATHLGNIAKLTLEFSSVKPETGKGGGKQRELFGGPTADPAPEDQTHQAGVENISATCATCGGMGYRGEDSEEACDACGGTGVVHMSAGSALAMVTCEDCHGSGNVEDGEGALGPCVTCHGTGKVEAEVTDDPLGDAVEDLREHEEAEAEEVDAAEESA